MKELSIEEKAKAYDRVSKEVKDFFEGRQKMYSDVSQTLKYLFPELKESEDKKIVDAIRKALESKIEDLGNGVTKTACIAWLEKQGVQKPQRMISAEAKEAMYNKPAWSEEDEVYLNTTIAYLKDAKDFKKTAENCIDWLKKLKQRIGDKL